MTTAAKEITLQRPCPKCAGSGLVELAPEMADVLRVLPGTARELAEKLDVKPGSMGARLTRMLDDDLIVRHRARGGNMYEYHINPVVEKIIGNHKRK